MALPGLSFEIVRTSAPVGIRADRTAIIALTERGPAETPTVVGSFDEFTDRFGTALPGMLGALAAQGYYDNGGQQLIVTRFVPGEAAAASGTLPVVGVDPKRMGAPVPLVASGPGTFGNDVQVQTTLSMRRRVKGSLSPAVPPSVGFQVSGLTPSDVGAPARLVAVARGTPAAVQWGTITAGGTGGMSPTFAPGVPATGFPPSLPPTAYVEVYDPTFSLTILEPGRANVVVSGLDLRQLDAARALLAGTSVTIPPIPGEVSLVPGAPLPPPELPLAGVVSLCGGGDGLSALPPTSDRVANLAASFQRCIDALEVVEQPPLLPDIVIAPDLWSAVWGTKGQSFLAFDSPRATALADQMVLSAWRTSDRVVIVDPPLQSDFTPFTPADLVAWRAERYANLGPAAASGPLVGMISAGTDFAATFTPWVQIVAGGTYRGDDTLLVPPSAYVAGRMARTSRERGPWIATGNVALQDVVGLDARLSIQDQEALQAAGISPLRVELPMGATIQGVRSLSFPDRAAQGWGYLSTRRLFNFLRRALTPIGLSYVFEPNTPATWIALRRDLTRVLRDVFLAGGLAGSKPSDGFYVKIDATLNPPSAIDAGVITAQIGVAPAVPLEFLVVLLVLQENTASVTEASS